MEDGLTSYSEGDPAQAEKYLRRALQARAGATGKAIWTLLPRNADWRWGIDNEDSAWYPTMHLFRQQIDGDWSGVIERLAAALCVLTAKLPKS